MVKKWNIVLSGRMASRAVSWSHIELTIGFSFLVINCCTTKSHYQPETNPALMLSDLTGKLWTRAKIWWWLYIFEMIYFNYLFYKLNENASFRYSSARDSESQVCDDPEHDGDTERVTATHRTGTGLGQREHLCGGARWRAHSQGVSLRRPALRCHRNVTIPHLRWYSSCRPNQQVKHFAMITSCNLQIETLTFCHKSNQITNIYSLKLLCSFS